MIFTEYPNDFWHKRKINNFDPYNVLLAIATNIHVLLMTAFVLQGHIFLFILAPLRFSSSATLLLLLFLMTIKHTPNSY